MYVYCIVTDTNPPLLKVGKAADVQRRLSELQTGCPHDLSIAASLKCKSEAHAFAVEQAAHEYLAASRKRGEWFLMHQKPTALIDFLNGAYARLEVSTITDLVRKKRNQRKSDARKARRDQHRAFLEQFRQKVGQA